MQTMRVVRAALIATLVLAVVACGSEDVGTGGGPSGATALKAGALVYVEGVTDPDSDQWQQTEDLLRRFPDGERWIAKLRELVADQGVDWEGDVKPALGATTALAVYPKSGASAHVVGLTDPEDPQKTVALVEKLDKAEGGDPSVTRIVGDWVFVSDSEVAIDAAVKPDGGSALADEAGFKAAMEKLPDDALTRVYADPAAAVETVGSADADVGRSLRMLGLDDLDFAGAWAKAKDKGAEVAFAAAGEGSSRLLGTGEPYTSALLDRVPSDAFAFISFRGEATTEQLEALRGNPLYAMGVGELERTLGVKLADLVQLFSGEVALYARTAVPIPEVTLLLDSDTAEQDREDAARLLRTIAQRLGGTVTEQGGVTTANFGDFSLHVGAAEGAVVLSTSRDVFTRSRSDSLADSDRYKDALDAAGAPDEYTAIVYVDLAEALALLRDYLGFTGQEWPPQARNLEPLRSLVAWGTRDGNTASSQAFVEID
jgi:hypothetical protein